MRNGYIWILLNRCRNKESIDQLDELKTLDERKGFTTRNISLANVQHLDTVALLNI